MITPQDLDQVELEIARAYEASEFRRVPSLRSAKVQYQLLAKRTLSKPRTINIRIAERDLQRIKALAAEQGLPYQTFISALVHQYSSRPTTRAKSIVASTK